MRRSRWGGALVFLALIGLRGPLVAQEREQMVIRCADGAAPQVVASCQEAVLALEAIRAGAGLSMTLGSDIPGFGSTVGLAESGRPLLSAAVRYGIARLDTPVLVGTQEIPAPTGTLTLASVQADVALGVFNGFTPRSGLRGMFAVDLLGTAGITLFPGADGFRSNEISYGYGARVALLREGFSNPGITVSVMRREFDEPVGYGTLVDGVQLGMDPGSTAARLTVGRDFFPIGVVAGAGLDWYGGDVSMVVRDRESLAALGQANSSDFTTRRAVAFLGGQYTHLVFQGSLELGWAQGFDGFDGYAGDYDPGAGTLFGSVAVRLTF